MKYCRTFAENYFICLSFMRKELLATYCIKKDFSVIKYPKLDSSFIPLEEHARLSNCIFVLCTHGELEFSINLKKETIRANEILMVTPNQIIQCFNMSEDFSGYFLIFRPEFAEDISLFRNTLPFLMEIGKKPLFTNLSKENVKLFSDYCEFVLLIEDNPLTRGNINILKSLLTSFLHILNAFFEKNLINSDNLIEEKQCRGNLIFKKFLNLLVENYTKERSVSFYADKLCITPKYLGTICREVGKKLATDIIASAVILDAKTKLQKEELTVQEISNSLNFPNPSFFGRYFKRYTGMSPMKYREAKK